MKKQLILLLVASAAIGSLNAAATSRLSSAARTAFTSGRQRFQSTLPSNALNIAKQNAYFGARTGINPSNITKTEPVIQRSFGNFNQQSASPGYWGQFKNWFNNLFANRSQAALATGTAALGGGAIIKSWIDEHPVMSVAYAEEDISSHRIDMPSKEKLQKIFNDLELEDFIEKTDIIKKLADRYLNAYTVIRIITLALYDYKKDLQSDDPEAIPYNQVLIKTTQANLNEVYKKLFKYYPEIIQQLKDEGLIK